MVARLVSVIGAGSPTPGQYETAVAVGRAAARAGLGVVTGGLGGVMEAACRGCSEEGGTTVGIIPGTDPAQANPYCTIVIPTGMGQARNVLVVLTGIGAVAIGGGPGTLSEIGHALKAGKVVVGIDTWDVKGLVRAQEPEEAVARLIELTSRP